MSPAEAGGTLGLVRFCTLGSSLTKITSLKGPSPNTVTLEFRASTYEFGRTQFNLSCLHWRGWLRWGMNEVETTGHLQLLTVVGSR